jgi:hypothetical protein
MAIYGETKLVIEEGIVIRGGVGGYDCTVKIRGQLIPCSTLSRQQSLAFGVGEGNIPVEGTHVLVILNDRNPSFGWIVSAAPMGQHVLNQEDATKRRVHSFYPNDKFRIYSENCAYIVPFMDKKWSGKKWLNTNRANDILPGESMMENESHAGMLVSMYQSEITAGDSFVRVDRMDDAIRERSTNFTHWSNEHAVSEFNDGGHISAEGRYYSYQGELLGTEGHKGPHYHLPSETENREPRPRIRFWKSFLGNLLSYFVVRARRTKSDFDTTLASMHVSQAGNVIIKAGGGVSLERYERIPTPKRLKHAWDPQGDREVPCPHEPFKPFIVENPHDRGLAEASKQAWEVKTHYQRWDELKKDFKVQNEDEVKLPQDDDEDPKHSNEIRYTKYRDRHAGLFIGDDGSIIIRDTWGSEIVMLGGNILINSPGNVITTTNKDIVSIARGTVAMRGTESAELTSEEKHVRIHAKQLVEIAGGIDSETGGVLIESVAKGSIVKAPEEAGEKARIAGVVVRSENAGCSISGNNTYVTGRDNVFITGGPDGAIREGNVFIDGKMVIETADKTYAAVSHQTIEIITENVAAMASPNYALLAGDKGATILNARKITIPWIRVDADLSKLFADAQEIFDRLQDSAIIMPFSWDNLCANAVFSFRSAVEAKTNEGIEPWKKNENFTMYEPWWQVMKKLGDPNIEKATPYHPKAETVHKTKCWPYLPSIEEGDFRNVELPVNIKVWWSKPREDLANTEENLKDYPMSEFMV